MASTFRTPAPVDVGTTAVDATPPWADHSFFGHPRGLATLFLTELWERFSYYGLRPLLVLFMSAALAQGGFGFTRPQASAVVGIYAASVYLASLPGGWVADRVLGLRRAVLAGAVLITLGHLSIGLSGFAVSKTPFFLGLVLIVLGTGLLKPNASAMVGDLYPEGGARRDAGFSIFYMGINSGAIVGQIVAGQLGEQVGWHWGFGIAGFGMLIGLITYALRAPRTLGTLGTAPSQHPDPAVDAARRRGAARALAAGVVVLAAAFGLAASGVVSLDPQTIAKSMVYVLGGTTVLYFGYLFALGGLVPDERKRVLVVFVLFVFAAVFWAAFEQAPTSLNLFAKDFTERHIFGFEVSASAFQSINSMFIVLLAPVFAGIWERLGRAGRDVSAPAKFVLGLLAAAAGFGLMIVPARALVASGGALKVSPLWLTASYCFQSVGELCVSPVGLSSMTKLSPRRYVGQMMGVWFLALSVGNLIAGLVGGSVDPEKLAQTPALFLWTTVALLVAAAALAALVAPVRRMLARAE
ncbi:MFS transporter [Gemmatimonadetes bacterium T265]|nr:MFS transporter [Gemmatimonadetes bacterium T265]